MLIFSYLYSESIGYYFSVIDSEFVLYKVVLVGAGVLLLALMIKPSVMTPKELSYFLFVYMLYIPTLAVAAISIDSFELVYLVFTSALILGVDLKVPPVSFKAIKFRFSLPEVLVCLNLILFISIVFKYRSILDIPSFSEVYALRLKARGLTDYTFGLILSWSKFVFAPLGFLLGVFYKRKFLLISSLLLYFSIYISTGAKSAVIYPFLLYFICFVFQYVSVLRIKTLMACGIVALVFISMAIEVYFSFVIYPYTVERAFIAPGVLSNLYYEFFSDNEKAYLGYSFLSSFIDYGYDLEPAFLIGQEYFRLETRANASFFADGYANFGIIGVIIFSLIVRGLIFLYSAISFNWSKSVSNTFFVPFALYLINASPLTMLVTGGFFLVLILGLFFEVD